MRGTKQSLVLQFRGTATTAVAASWVFCRHATLYMPPTVVCENLRGPMAMSQVELRILSIGAGEARRWALYAVPCADEEDTERFECYSLEELDILLTTLKRAGVNDS